jgi:transcriptional regulator with XRE-family HTH domain
MRLREKAGRLMAETDLDQAGDGTIGERLRTAREAKGLSLEDVARQTRIPIRHLEHIERSEWDALPAATYSVGFARSYAITVGLDGAQIGAELRQELGVSRGSSGPATAFYEPADPARVPPRSIAIVAVILAALLVAGYLFWRSNAVGDAPEEPQIADAPAGQPGTAPAQPPAAPPAATGPVVLTAIEDVWLRIYERGGGPALFQGILKAGQTYQVPPGAQAPLIRTGRPQALRVTVGSAVIPPLGEPERTIADVSLLPADLAARAGGGAPAPAAAPGTPQRPAGGP